MKAEPTLGSFLLGWGRKKPTNTNNNSSSFGRSLGAWFLAGGRIKRDFLSFLLRSDSLIPDQVMAGAQAAPSNGEPAWLVNKLTDWEPVGAGGEAVEALRGLSGCSLICSSWLPWSWKPEPLPPAVRNNHKKKRASF